MRPTQFDRSYSDKLMMDTIINPPTTLHSECILIDSRSRNVTRYPSSKKFKVIFDPNSSPTDCFIQKRLKNVKSIALQDVVIPDSASGHPYLILVIPELASTNPFLGTTEVSKNAFAILIPDFSNTSGAFRNYRVQTDTCHCFKIFDTPISISAMTFELYNPDGELVDINDDDANNINTAQQVMYSLKVVTEVANNIMKSHIT